MTTFRIMTIGWDPRGIARHLLGPITARTGIEFVHGVLGDVRRVAALEQEFPDDRWIFLGKASNDPLPAPDRELLASLESTGVPTIRAMLRGDQALRHRSETEGFSYATMMARALAEAIERAQPDVVLASFDGLHSAMSLAVAKSLGVPWVALTFSAIPNTLTAFCNGMTPNAILPITRPVDDRLRADARNLVERFRSGGVKVMAYRAPRTWRDWSRRTVSRTLSFGWRVLKGQTFSSNRFVAPTVRERLGDLVRRSWNRLRFPWSRVLTVPPEPPYVFFPLHMSPEATIDTWAPMYQNQLDFIARLALAVPADHELVVKLHFSDPDNYSRVQLTRLMNLPGIRVVSPFASGHRFIRDAAMVVGITGTASLEAAMLGKPVLLFGDSPYQHFPVSDRAERPDRLHAQILGMLEAARPSEDAIVEALARHLSRYLPGRNNDWTRPATDEELDRLAGCFDRLRAYIEAPGAKQSWYTRPPFTSTFEGSSAPSMAAFSL